MTALDHPDGSVSTGQEGSGVPASPSRHSGSAPSRFPSRPSASTANAAPREDSDPGAIEWVLDRLSERQTSAILALAAQPSDWATASMIGASGVTLCSLLDFRRGERGILTPLMILTNDFNPFIMRFDWALTSFGKRVAQAIEARRAATGTGAVEDESAVGNADAPESPRPSPPEVQS